MQAHTVLRPEGPRGFVFINKHKRGQKLAAGETLGIVRHPFTGEVIAELKAERPGIMLHAGASWPVVLEGDILAILGDEIRPA
jgi:predicted deacylase